MKKCQRCHEEKPLREFGPTGKSKRCRDCARHFAQVKAARIKLELAGELPEKTCWRCHRTLPIENFAWYEHGKGRLQECLDCHDVDGPKRCPRCGEIKLRSEFHRKADGRSSYCKPCNKESCRERSRLRQYGLAPEDYEAAVTAQNGCCAICGKQPEVLWVDHDHSCCPKNTSCGKCRRGLLCMMCNGGLGMFLDDAEVLKKAIAYLETHETAVALAHGVLFRAA